jgi:hypothetical protein
MSVDAGIRSVKSRSITFTEVKRKWQIDTDEANTNDRVVATADLTETTLAAAILAATKITSVPAVWDTATAWKMSSPIGRLAHHGVTAPDIRIMKILTSATIRRGGVPGLAETHSVSVTAATGNRKLIDGDMKIVTATATVMRKATRPTAAIGRIGAITHRLKADSAADETRAASEVGGTEPPTKFHHGLAMRTPSAVVRWINDQADIVVAGRKTTLDPTIASKKTSMIV